MKPHERALLLQESKEKVEVLIARIDIIFDDIREGFEKYGEDDARHSPYKTYFETISPIKGRLVLIKAELDKDKLDDDELTRTSSLLGLNEDAINNAKSSFSETFRRSILSMIVNAGKEIDYKREKLKLRFEGHKEKYTIAGRKNNGKQQTLYRNMSTQALMKRDALEGHKHTLEGLYHALNRPNLTEQQVLELEERVERMVDIVSKTSINFQA